MDRSSGHHGDGGKHDRSVNESLVTDVPITVIFRGTFPFLVAMVALLAIVIIFMDMIL